MRLPLALLAVLLDRLTRYEAAATILGFAFNPMPAAAFPELDPGSLTYARSSATRSTSRSPRGVERWPPPPWRPMPAAKLTTPEQNSTRSRNRRHTRLSKLCVGITLNAEGSSWSVRPPILRAPNAQSGKAPR
jgi:hypothetical protein